MNESLKKDALAQCASIHGMFSGGLGYLFSSSVDGNSVARGMFCHRLHEIDPQQWDYFIWFGALVEPLKGSVISTYNLNSPQYAQLMRYSKEYGLGHFLVHQNEKGWNGMQYDDHGHLIERG